MIRGLAIAARGLRPRLVVAAARTSTSKSALRLSASSSSSSFRNLSISSRLFSEPLSSTDSSSTHVEESTSQPAVPEEEIETISEENETISEQDVRADHNPVDPLHTEFATPSPPKAARVYVPAEETAARTVFVGNLAFDVDAQWLGEAAENLLGQGESVQTVRVARDHVGNSKGFAFVEFSSPKYAEEFLARGAMEIGDRTANFQPARVRREAPVDRTRTARANDTHKNPPSRTLWLGNLNWDAESADIERAFTRYGTIVRIHLPVERVTGRKRGIAYVEFSEKDGAVRAMDAITAKPLSLLGRTVRLDFAATESVANALKPGYLNRQRYQGSN